MNFSIIIPVYNKGLFLRGAIESVLNQTYNTKKNVEIILVNDGSTDESHSICEEYLKKLPSVFKYIYTANNGPSAARNYGVSLVSKEVDMVGFLDADDYLDKHALKRIYSFLKKNCVDMVTLPVRYFNSKRNGSEHSLNYRFDKGDNVINIHKEYKAIHFYTGGLFIKRKRLIENIPFFDENLHFWEDAFSINKYLLEQPIYGVVSGAYYYYRRQDKNNISMVDEYWRKKERYTDLVNNGYSALIK